MSMQDPHAHLESVDNPLKVNQDTIHPDTIHQDTIHPKNSKKLNWIELHFPIILYIWFWFGLILCALFAPADGVLMLKSTMITRGWHLIVVAVVLSTPIIWLYCKRVSKSKKS